MEVYFDDCTEHLLKEYEALKPEEKDKTQKLYEELKSFKEDCIKTGICPEGELIRGYICRQFQRDAVKRMKGRLTSLNEDNTIKRIVRQTNVGIETIGKKSEAERAYVTLRNLLIIAENIAEQEKKRAIPTLQKQPLALDSCTITAKGVKSFASIMGFTVEKDIQKLLKPAGLKPVLPGQACEIKYRHLFFNLLTNLILAKEVKEDV